MFPFSRNHPAHTQRAIFFVPSTGRQAQSLVVDSTGGGRGCLFSRFYFHVPGLFSFLLTQRHFSLSLSFTLTLSVSFLRYLACRPESKKFTLDGASENISASRFASRPPHPRAAGPKVERGLEIYAPRVSLLVCPSVLRKSRIARAYGADRDISIRYLDPLLRPSGRQLFFPGIYPSFR